jgi:hypothetical protein
MSLTSYRTAPPRVTYVLVVPALAFDKEFPGNKARDKNAAARCPGSGILKS